MRVRIAILVLLLSAPLLAESPIIDLGWLRASQVSEGWVIEKAAMFTESGQKLQPGDIVISIDNRRIDDENALSASNELAWVRNANTARVIRHGSPLTLQFRLPDPLLKAFFSGLHREVYRYPKDFHFAAISLPDLNGKITRWKVAGGTSTLIHFWSPT